VTDDASTAARLFSDVWRLMEMEDRSPDEDVLMVHQAHASLYHWLSAPGTGPAQVVRGEWLCSRVYAVLRRAEPALFHARRALEVCRRHGIADWDLGYVYEALARAAAVAGDVAAGRKLLETAYAALSGIAGADDRELLMDDLASVEAELAAVA